MDQQKPPDHTAALRKIAGALGVPINDLFAEEPSVRLTASEDECLRLWSEIRTEAGKQQALEALGLIAKLEQK